MSRGDILDGGLPGRALALSFAVEMAVAILCLAIMAAVVLADVVGRELLGQGIEGAQKLAVYAFVCAGFLGLPLTTAQGGHLRPHLFDGVTGRLLSPAALARMQHLPTALLSLGLAGSGLSFVVESIGFAERSPSLHIPVWWVQTVVPWAFLSSGLRHLTYVLVPSLAPRGDAS